MAKLTCNFFSYTLKRAIDITVIIPTVTFPEAYGEGMPEGTRATHHKEHKYPVLYLLHGGGNDHHIWNSYTNIELFAEERNIAVVLFSAENKCYINWSEQDPFYDFMETELPEFVTSMFPISSRAQDTYIAGLSMGAVGTLVHALGNPDRYRAMGVFSMGMFVPKTGAYGMEQPPQYDPEYLAEQLRKAGRIGPDAFFAAGEKDVWYDNCKKTAQVLEQDGYHVKWVSMPEYGHEWRFWNIVVEQFLDWLPRTDAYANTGKRKV